MSIQTLANIKFTDQSGTGSECIVYDTINPDIVFKLYDGFYNYDDVSEIIRLNREYAEYELAPQVYSDVIKIGECFGYYTERIEPDPMNNNIKKLAVQLGINNDDEPTVPIELKCNCGLTKNNKLILFDFGLFTLKVLGLIDCTGEWDER